MQASSNTIVEIIVPKVFSGVIIGKGGEMIAKLQRETCTRMQFKPENFDSSERAILVLGRQEHIAQLAERLTELISNAVPHQWQQPSSPTAPHQTFHIIVPTDKAGLIVGRGGNIVKQIELETGASVNLSHSCLPNQKERVVEVVGTPEQLRHVKHLIRIRLGEIPLNSPLLDEPEQELAQQQWDKAQSSVDDSQLTGKSDYSAEWIDYYRSLNMHAHADDIEEQVKKRNQLAHTAGC